LKDEENERRTKQQSDDTDPPLIVGLEDAICLPEDRNPKVEVEPQAWTIVPEPESEPKLEQR